MRVKLPSIPLRVNHWLGLTALALALAGCFQSAGSSVQPTSVDVNQLQNLPTPTVDIPTPLPPTPELATDVPPPTTEGVTDIAPTLPPPTLDFSSVTGDPPTATLELATLAPTQGVVAPAGDLPATPTPIPPMELPMTPTAGGLPATPTGLPTDQPCEHTVQPGEWFYSVARLYNIDPLDLVAANPRTNPDALQVGDKLIIPNCGKTPTVAPLAPAATTASGQVPAPALATLTPASGTVMPTAIILEQMVYTVVAGDTLGKIAAQYGVTVDQIMKANNLTSDSLQIGQRLVIPVAPPQ